MRFETNHQRLYKQYSEWCNARGIAVMSEEAFAADLASRGVDQKDDAYQGIMTKKDLHSAFNKIGPTLGKRPSDVTREEFEKTWTQL